MEIFSDGYASLKLIPNRIFLNEIYVNEKNGNYGYQEVITIQPKKLAANLIWRFGDRQRHRQINFRHIRTQELRNEILLRNRKSPNLNSANI